MFTLFYKKRWMMFTPFYKKPWMVFFFEETVVDLHTLKKKRWIMVELEVELFCKKPVVVEQIFDFLISWNFMAILGAKLAIVHKMPKFSSHQT